MRTTTAAKPTTQGAIEDLDVIVVGAGFAGIYLLDRLRSMGMAVQVFEAGGGLGGVWYWNCYPGARVDSPGPIYQYSRDDVWRKWQFSELYPSWQELRDYFRYVDERLGLSRDIRFNRRVNEALFDPANGAADDGNHLISVSAAASRKRRPFGSKNVRQTLSEWGTVGKPAERGFPHMLVGYMRVSTDSDRQVLDLQRDALVAAGIDERHLF